MSDVLTNSNSAAETKVSSDHLGKNSDYRPALDSRASKSSSFKTAAIIAALTALCFAAYGRTLFDYLYCDDFMFLGFAHKVCQQGGFGWLADLFTTPMSEVQASQLVFRPLPVIWFALEYKLLGLNVIALHGVNLLMYSATTSIIFFWLAAFLQLRGCLAQHLQRFSARHSLQ
jgi:hypothetical protein